MGQSQKPKPGDLIEINRGPYQHWAVYVGDGWVVHVTSPPGAKEPGAVSTSLMSVPTEKAMVMKEKLQKVVGNNTWRISNSLDKKNKPRSARTIVEEALSLVGKKMKYDVISKNCEHFATKLRYGIAESFQVKENAGKYVALTVAAGAVVGVVAGPAVGAIVVAAAVFSLFKKKKKTKTD